MESGNLQTRTIGKTYILSILVAILERTKKGILDIKLASIPIVGNIITKFTPKKLIKKSLEDAYADDSKINDALVDRHFNLLLREGNRKATIDFFRQRATPLPEKIKVGASSNPYHLGRRRSDD